jgi:RHS repeat-associated protein
VGIAADTDASGQAIFNVPEADYKIRADYLAGRHWSDDFNGTDATVDIAHGLAAVHVVEAGLDLFDVPVYLFNEDGRYLGRRERTDSAGMVSFLVPEGTYKFRVDYHGRQIWSEGVSILADEQTAIELDVGLLMSDLTTRPDPKRFDGTPPVYEAQKLLVASLGSVTNVLPTLITGQSTVDRLYFFINDHLGTPQVVVDDAGQVVWAGDYEPFGAVDVGSGFKVGNSFRFAGQYYDHETWLHYNYHRYYNPKTGKYLTPDPIGLSGGINLYAYADQNPINEIDPYGLMGLSIVTKTVKGAVKYISKNQAKKKLQNKGTVTVIGKGTSKKAKKLYKEAHPGKKLKRHDPHPDDPLSKHKHWQKKSGDGSHANFIDKILGGIVFIGSMLNPFDAISGELANSDDLNSNGIPDWEEWEPFQTECP